MFYNEHVVKCITVTIKSNISFMTQNIKQSDHDNK